MRSRKTLCLPARKACISPRHVAGGPRFYHPLGSVVTRPGQGPVPTPGPVDVCPHAPRRPSSTPPRRGLPAHRSTKGNCKVTREAGKNLFSADRGWLNAARAVRKWFPDAEIAVLSTTRRAPLTPLSLSRTTNRLAAGRPWAVPGASGAPRGAPAMGTCEPGQGRKSAAISNHPFVRWVPRRLSGDRYACFRPRRLPTQSPGHPGTDRR